MLHNQLFNFDMKKRFNLKLENNLTSSRSVAEKYRQVVAQDDHDESLVLIHYRGTSEELTLGVEYINSEDPLDRATGADILGQLGWTDQTFLEESVKVLIPMLKDSDAYVAYCAAAALGHRSAPEAIPYIIDISKHKDPQVRFGVVSGLLGHEIPEAVSTLILMSKDIDTDVRNWALFGLGSQIDTDTPEIRKALFDGLSDPDDEARGEAMVGLATRGDSCVVDAILKEWEGMDIGQLSIEAAEHIGDLRLLPCLMEFLERMDLSDDPSYLEQVERAIAACKPKIERVDSIDH